MAITNNHIQLFRNNDVFPTRKAAIERLGQFTSETIQDGTPVLARYTSGNTTKTLLALFYVTGTTVKYDIVGDSADTDSAIKTLETKLLGGASDDYKDFGKIEAMIKTLNGSNTTAGSVAKAVKDAVEALDVAEIKSDGQAIVAVSETNGKVSAKAGDIDATHVIQDAVDGETPAVTVKDAIDDLRTTVAANKVVTGDTSVSITQTDNGTALKVALANDEHVLSVDGGLKTTIALAEVRENLGTNVAKAYQLQGIGGAPLGNVQIEIPKDRSLKEVYLGTTGDTVDAEGNVTSSSTGDFQSLNFVYHLENGKYSLAAVDVSKFLSESEFADGLKVADHVVKVKLADGNEGEFLSVDANGVKLSGVQDAINKAQASATTVVDAAADTHISVATTTEADGHKRYTISDDVDGSNVILKGYTAATSGTPAATDSVNDAISKLFNLITAGGQSATAIGNELDKVETAIGLNEDGAHIATNGNYTSSAKTIAGEIAALDTQVKANEVNITKNKVVAGNGINVAEATEAGTTVSAKVNEASGLAVTADNGIEIHSIDAGTY